MVTPSTFVEHHLYAMHVLAAGASLKWNTVHAIADNLYCIGKYDMTKKGRVYCLVGGAGEHCGRWEHKGLSQQGGM